MVCKYLLLPSTRKVGFYSLLKTSQKIKLQRYIDPRVVGRVLGKKNPPEYFELRTLTPSL